MTDQTFNMNDEIGIRLTDFGRTVAVESLTVGEFDGNETLDLCFPEQPDGHRYFKLWEVMSIFGPKIAMGCELPFETSILLRSLR